MEQRRARTSTRYVGCWWKLLCAETVAVQLEEEREGVPDAMQREVRARWTFDDEAGRQEPPRARASLSLRPLTSFQLRFCRSALSLVQGDSRAPTQEVAAPLSPPPRPLSPLPALMNADQAQSALDIAKRHYNSDNCTSAIRFCKKSIALQSTPEAVALLARIEKAEKAAQASGASSATANPASASTTSARPTPRASTSKPTPPVEEKAREYTPAQAALVKRVKSCRVTQYYEILAIEKGCSDSEVKKAYRKVSRRALVGRRRNLLLISRSLFVARSGWAITLLQQ